MPHGTGKRADGGAGGLGAEQDAKCRAGAAVIDIVEEELKETGGLGNGALIQDTDAAARKAARCGLWGSCLP